MYICRSGKKEVFGLGVGAKVDRHLVWKDFFSVWSWIRCQEMEMRFVRFTQLTQDRRSGAHTEA
jgi:hypothetical protein